eukprot:m.476246 g.476246  ORF g.476246 m.476246 type:complete len:249 (-) comp40441_c0_seq1:112-858(-)
MPSKRHATNTDGDKRAGKRAATVSAVSPGGITLNLTPATSLEEVTALIAAEASKCCPGSVDNKSAAADTATTPTTSPCTVRCGAFPRGAMAALLARFPSVVRFDCEYPERRGLQLTNPDMKLLLAARTTALEALTIRAASDTAATKPPKFQGCGYRWLAKHATQLEELEISLHADVKQQLVERLRGTRLKRLVLRDVGPRASLEAVTALVARCPELTDLTLSKWDVSGARAEASLRKAGPKLRTLVLD